MLFSPKGRQTSSRHHKQAEQQRHEHTTSPGVYLLFSLIDPEQKHQLRQKHGRRCVRMDAPGVGLEASEAGEHQDGEEEGQHGDAQRGVCDQRQRLQISLQLLLTEVREGTRGGEKAERGRYWSYSILVGVDGKKGGKEKSSIGRRKM